MIFSSQKLFLLLSNLDRKKFSIINWTFQVYLWTAFPKSWITLLSGFKSFRKPNIFDNMLAIMEKHANNLENQVRCTFVAHRLWPICIFLGGEVRGSRFEVRGSRFEVRGSSTVPSFSSPFFLFRLGAQQVIYQIILASQDRDSNLVLLIEKHKRFHCAILSSIFHFR